MQSLKDSFYCQDIKALNKKNTVKSIEFLYCLTLHLLHFAVPKPSIVSVMIRVCDERSASKVFVAFSDHFVWFYVTDDACFSLH